MPTPIPPPLKSLLILQLLIVWICYCQTGQKLVKIQIQQIVPTAIDVRLEGSRVMTVEELVRRVVEDPAALVDLRTVYVTNWGTKSSSSSSPSSSNKPTTTTITSTSSSSLNTDPSKTTTITTKTEQTGNQPAKTTTTTTTSNNQLLNTQDVFNSVLGKINNPFLDIFGNGAVGGQGVSASATTVTNYDQGVPKTTNVVTTSVTQPANSQSSITTSSPSSSSSSYSITTPSSSSPSSTSPKPPQITSTSLPTLRQQMRALTNNLRSKNNAGSLTLNSLLTKIAQQHSDDMVQRGFFDHVNPDDQAPSDRAKRNGYGGVVGENIGYARSLYQVESNFQKSVGHRANAINQDWEEIGVGIAPKGDLLYVTVMFSPRNLAITPLTATQLRQTKSTLTSTISSQNPQKSHDQSLSTYTQQWVDSDRSIKLLPYVISRGGYRTALSYETANLPYSRKIGDVVKNNGYFRGGVGSRFGVGVGVRTGGEGLEVWVVYA